MYSKGQERRKSIFTHSGSAADEVTPDARPGEPKEDVRRTPPVSPAHPCGGRRHSFVSERFATPSRLGCSVCKRLCTGSGKAASPLSGGLAYFRTREAAFQRLGLAPAGRTPPGAAVHGWWAFAPWRSP